MKASCKGVNKALKKLGYTGKVYRSPKGYYYFSDDLMNVPSLYVYNINVYSIEEILNHVTKNLNHENH